MEEREITNFDNKIDTILYRMNSMDKKLTQIETRMEFRPAKICVDYLESRYVAKADLEALIDEKKTKDEENIIRKSNIIERALKIVQLLLTISIFTLLALQSSPDRTNYKHNTITESKE